MCGETAIIAWAWIERYFINVKKKGELISRVFILASGQLKNCLFSIIFKCINLIKILNEEFANIKT